MVRQWILRGFIALALIFSVAAVASPVYADDVVAGPCAASPSSPVCKTVKSGNPIHIIRTVTRIVAFLGGIVAVIVIAVAGLSYITSDGDAERIKNAKNAIVYALVGLAVIMLGTAIINFVINTVSS